MPSYVQLDPVGRIGLHVCANTYGAVSQPQVYLSDKGARLVVGCKESHTRTREKAEDISREVTVYSNGQKYTCLTFLGGGSYGQVYTFQNQTNPSKKLAVKIVCRNLLDADRANLTVFDTLRDLRQAQRFVECPVVYTCLFNNPNINPAIYFLVMEMGINVFTDLQLHNRPPVRLHYVLKVVELVLCLAHSWSVFPDIKPGNLVICLASNTTARDQADLVAIDVDSIYTLKAPAYVKSEKGSQVVIKSLKPKPKKLPVATYRCKELNMEEPYSEQNMVLVSYLAALVTIVNFIAPKSGYNYMAEKEASTRPAKMTFHTVISALNLKADKLSTSLTTVLFTVLKKLEAFSEMFEKKQFPRDVWAFLKTNMEDIMKTINPLYLESLQQTFVAKRAYQLESLKKTRPVKIEDLLDTSFEVLGLPGTTEDNPITLDDDEEEVSQLDKTLDRSFEVLRSPAGEASAVDAARKGKRKRQVTPQTTRLTSYI